MVKEEERVERSKARGRVKVKRRGAREEGKKVEKET